MLAITLKGTSMSSVDRIKEIKKEIFIVSGIVEFFFNLFVHNLCGSTHRMLITIRTF